MRYCEYGDRVVPGTEQCRNGHLALDGATPACLWCGRKDGTHSPACERAQIAERRIKEMSPLPGD